MVRAFEGKRAVWGRAGALLGIVGLAGVSVAADVDPRAPNVAHPGGVIIIPAPCGIQPVDDFIVVPVNGVAVNNNENGNGIPDGQEVIRCVTPLEWQAADVLWIGDQAPHNKIDDQIDIAPAAARFDVIVNYKRGTGQGDVAFLNAVGPLAQVYFVGKYITSIAVGGVNKAEIAAIAARPEVAFVEIDGILTAHLDVSRAAMCVVNGAGGCAQTIQNTFPTVNGNGINIAIFDTGVDDILHQSLLGSFRFGYNTFTQQEGNPDDDYLHGTHVASTALGRAATVAPGVAPQAGLIDVKVLDSNGSGTFVGVMQALEYVYDRRTTWNVGVINMSLGGSTPADGREALCQLVDLSAAMGIVTALSAGNAGFNLISLPAASTRAITVGSLDDRNTIPRADDVHSAFTSLGPRLNDGDADCIDELKPEVAAPGCHIWSGFPNPGIRAARWNTPNGILELCGTSMASPHIAGLAALIIQANRDAGRTILPLSVKQAVIQGSQPIAGYPPSATACDPVWNRTIGWGSVNGFTTLNNTMTGVRTDLSFPNYPSNPIWLSPDIRTQSPPRVNIANTIFATIQNRGPAAVSNIKVQFGVHVFSASVPTFFDIGTVNVPGTLAVNGIIEVGIGWTPQAASHQCAKAEVIYVADSNYGNNIAQRNLFVAASPVTFEVRNLLSTEQRRIDFFANIPNAQGWLVDITPPFVDLGADDCAVNITALPLPPFGTPNGTRKKIHIEAKIGACSLGGVSIDAIMHDCNGNGWDDYEDIRDGRIPDANGNGIPDICDPIACQLDLNFSGQVDFDDIEILMSTYGEEGVGDVNFNGITDDKDLESMVHAIGAICHIPHQPQAPGTH